MRKHILTAILVASLFQLAQAQVTINYTFWVGFKNKQNNPYSLNEPGKFLSQRSLDRRKKFTIPLHESDLPVTPSYTKQVAQLPGVVVKNTSRWLNGITITVEDSAAVKQLRQLPFVKEVRMVAYTQLHAIFDLGAIEEPAPVNKKKPESTEEPEVTYTPYSTDYYGNAWPQISMCNGQRLHQQGFTGKGLLIAVLDAGFNNFNQLPALSLTARSPLIARDLVQMNDTVFDDDEHGLQVLSCMAAMDPGKMVGTAPEADFLLLRSEEASTEYPVEEINWVCAAEVADSAGADLISSSLGYTRFDDRSMGHTKKEMNGKTSVATLAADMAVAKGILVSNSSGNEGDDKTWQIMGAPGDAFSIFTVGSVTITGKHASFSSVGPTSDKRIKPTVATMGELVTVLSGSGDYYKSSGTSFSTPIFSGMLACLYQANSNASPAKVMEAVTMSCSQFPFPDNKLGFGIPDFALANKILGGDKEYPHTENRILDISIPASSPYLTITLFTADETDIKVELQDANGKRVLSAKYHQGKGQVKRYFVKGFKRLKKGAYTLVINYGSGIHKASLTKP